MVRLSSAASSFISSVRLFAIVAEYQLAQKRPEVALQVIGESVYFLKHYRLNKYLKVRCLSGYAAALTQTQRYFEASEMYQQYCDLVVSERDIQEELLFIPDYLI